MTKTVKFGKTKFDAFDVIIRIRQALNKKEFESVTETKYVLEKTFVPFNEYSEAALPQIKQEVKSNIQPINVKEVMMKIAKEVQE